MDSLSKELHEFLVRLHYHPEEFDERVIHYMEHLFMLLSKDDEEAILHYFGIVGRAQMLLADISERRGVTQETMMESIDINIRKLAVTPEWQEIKKL